MIPVSAKIKAAFQSDSMIKTYYLHFPEVVNPTTQQVEKKEKILTSINIKSDSITLTEPMCSEEQLKFGCTEAATFECEVEFEAESLVGRTFNVFLMLGDYDEPQDIFTVGRYYVDSEEISGDRRTKTITAYDGIYILNKLDVTYWIYQQTFPMTVKQFRDSLFAYIGVSTPYPQVDRSLPNDNTIMDKNPLDGQTDIMFDKIIRGICEINACFGHINRTGEFDYILLTATDSSETYPSKNTYPSSTLFPKSIKGKNYYISPHLIKSDISWQTYKCKPADIVQVRNSAGAVVGDYYIDGRSSYSNTYVIQNNYMVDAFESANLQNMTINFANAIKNITYTPCTANIKMDLSLEVGDPITLTGTDGSKIPTFIFSRTMTGISSAFDEIEATGYEEWLNDPPDNDGAVQEMMDDLTDINNRLTDLEGKQASGEGQIQIISTDQLPASPRRNVLYLIQGKVYVN